MARMGRPPTVGNGERVTATVRLTVGQYKAIRKAAKKVGQRKTEWMRNILVEASKESDSQIAMNEAIARAYAVIKKHSTSKRPKAES